MRCPTILVYRVPWLTYRLARHFVRGVRFIGLANILAKRELMPELIQDTFTPERLALELKSFLADPARRAAAQAEYDQVNRTLGAPGASVRAARAIVETMRAKRLVTPPA
jgi:lipid-A-disaccharide synthase